MESQLDKTLFSFRTPIYLNHTLDTEPISTSAEIVRLRSRGTCMFIYIIMCHRNIIIIQYVVLSTSTFPCIITINQKLSSFQFLNRRRISSCRPAPKCTTESNIDDVYLHELAISNQLCQFTPQTKCSLIENLDSIKDFNDRSDGIGVRSLHLTSDDYVEQRMPQYTFNDISYTNIRDIDLSKYNNEVISRLNVYLFC